VSLWDEIRELWHHASPEEGDPVPNAGGAVIEEILDPGFLGDRLREIKEAGPGLLSDEQYQQMFSELERDEKSPISGANPSQGQQAYLPRSPAVSLLQSTLTDCVLSRVEDLVKPLPPDNDSFADFVLREFDVFRKFGPCDAGWVESVISKGLSLLSGKPKFVDGRAPDVEIAADARLVVVGDWGTGLTWAQAVGREMAKHIAAAKSEGREVHVLHLGDVYYSGWKEEYRSRFLPFWPVRSADEGVASWSINGNHDMYSGGHGYFGYLLRDPRFAGHNGSSYFCLHNADWQLLGLDSAYEDGDLTGEQGEWVAKKQTASQRKTMLFTHHEPFSAFVGTDQPMLKRLEKAFQVRPIDAWLWGHEHLACVYRPQTVPYLKFGSCIGHGGVPVLLETNEEPHSEVSWRGRENKQLFEDLWQLFGFAVLDFDGPTIDVAYYDQLGGEPVNKERIE
jgi:calcineurin-like phosphoesterase family protein